MRSHVTPVPLATNAPPVKFQYRKRYEVTCDSKNKKRNMKRELKFQYRKRYEVTCDLCPSSRLGDRSAVSIPQAV